MSDYSTVAPPQSNLNQSQAFAAALQRAKQIAAKIQPNTQQQSASVGGNAFKRSHNDDSDSGPDVKKFTSPGQDSYSQHSNNSNSGAPGGAGNMSQALAQAAAVAARLAATAGTTCEEQIRYPETIVTHMVGRNSNDTLSHIQAESGCKVVLSQDSETLCTLRGSRETVSKGREMIQQLVNQNGGGTVEVVLTINMPPPGPSGYPPYQEIMIPGTKVGLVIGKGGDTIKQLQEKTGAKMVIIQDGPNQELIKPLRISGDAQKIEHAKQLVLELIADKEAQAVGRGGNQMGGMGGSGAGGGGGHNGGGGFNGGMGGGGETAEVFVPKIAVGVVIGKGGDMIRKIQTECGCKLQFIQGKNDEPGDRRCVIQGSHQQVEDAKRTIEGLIENMMQRNRNNPNGAGGGTGDNTNSNYGYGYGVNHTQQPAREEITFSVPASKCGIVIGRGGETIKLINQQTGAYCEMDRSAVNPPSEKLFKCKGTPEQIEAARQMIAEKINMELPILSRKSIGNAPNHQGHQSQQGGYNNPMQDANAAYQQQWGGYAQQGGWDQSQQQQQQPQQQMGGAQMGPGAAAAASGQADYSTQWIEYYKSMGMQREAEMIEQQLKAKQVAAGGNPMASAQQMSSMPQQQQQQQQPQPQAAAAAAAAAGGAGQGQDYSAQWAEYYRSIGKHEEAEAIEKQMKGHNGQASNAASAGMVPSSQNSAAAGAGSGGASGGNAAGGGGVPQSQPGYPQGMTPSQYAQYSQYYAAAAAAGQGGVQGGGGGYPQQQQQQQQAYGGYGAPGGYPGAPQPGMPGGGNSGPQGSNQQKPGGNKND